MMRYIIFREIKEDMCGMAPVGFAKRYKNKDFEPKNRTAFLAKLVYNNVLRIDD